MKCVWIRFPPILIIFPPTSTASIENPSPASKFLLLLQKTTAERCRNFPNFTSCLLSSVKMVVQGSHLGQAITYFGVLWLFCCFWFHIFHMNVLVLITNLLLSAYQWITCQVIVEATNYYIQVKHYLVFHKDLNLIKSLKLRFSIFVVQCVLIKRRKWNRRRW